MNPESGTSLGSGASAATTGRAACERMRLRALECGLAIVVLAVVIAGGGRAFAQTKSSCVECHSQMDGELAAPVEQMKGDIHAAKGLSCSDCHGGNPTLDDPEGAMDPRKGFVGKPRVSDLPAFCGRCHSNAEMMKRFAPAMRVDQEQEYLTSVHGKKLKAGDEKVATCVSCHGHHGIRAVSDPLSSVYPTNVAETCARCHGDAEYMKSYGIPTDQYAKYKTSVHANALYERQDVSAPTCNDCHGNHGAAPPGVASVANVCGQCHARQSELFSASTHKEVFDLMEVGECIECHSNHGIVKPSDEMIGAGEKSVCTSCHAGSDSGFQSAVGMRTRLDEMGVGITRATDILNRAERAGMEVSRPKFELNEARDALTQARVLIHSFSPEAVNKVAEPGLAVSTKQYQAGEAALAELGFRRRGLFASLFFLLFLAALVYLKLREMESR